MADGSITAVVDLDDKKAQTELNRLAKRIDDLNAKVKQASEAKLPLVDQASELGAQLDAAKAKLEEMRSAAQGTYTTDQITVQKENVAALQTQWNAVNQQIAGYDRKIATATSQIELATNRAGELSAQLAGVRSASEEAGDAMREMGESGTTAASEISSAMNNAAKRVEKLGHRIMGLAKRVFVFTVITSGLRSMRTGLVNAVKANDEAAKAVGNLKGALLTLAQPILGTVIPALTTLVGVLTQVISAVASVVSLLFGTTSQDAAAAAEGLSKEKKEIKGTGSAAQKAAKQLAAFDEINKLSVKEDDGGGSGGAADAESTISPLFDAIKNFELPENIVTAIEWIRDNLDLVRDIAIAVGSAFLGWKIASALTRDLSKIAGIAMALGGATVYVEGFMNAWKNGPDWGNLKQMLAGSALQAAGLGMAFGRVAAGISLIASGAGMLVPAIKDVIQNGWDLENTLTVLSGIAEIIAGIALAFGETPALIAAAVAALALGIDHIIENWPHIKKMYDDLIHGDFAGAMLEYLNQTGPLMEVQKWITDAIFGEGTWERSKKLLEEHGAELNEIIWDKINEIFKPVLSWLDENVIQPISEAFTAAVTWLDENVIQPISKKLTNAVRWIRENVVEPTKTAFDVGLQTIQKLFEGTKLIIQALWITVSGWFDENVLQPIKNFVEGAKESIVRAVQTALSDIKSITETVASWINQNVIQPVRNFVEPLIDDIRTYVSDLWDDVMSIIEKVEGFVKQKIVDPVKSLFKGLINDIISVIERGINGIINGINGFLGAFNSAASWAASVVGENWSGIGLIQPVGIPRLAQGAVIPPNREFLAVLGDQRSGNNIEAPESELQAMADRAASANAALLREILNAIREGKIMVVDNAVFARVVYNANKNESARIGGSLVNVR